MVMGLHGDGIAQKWNDPDEAPAIALRLLYLYFLQHPPSERRRKFDRGSPDCRPNFCHSSLPVKILLGCLEF